MKYVAITMLGVCLMGGAAIAADPPDYVITDILVETPNPWTAYTDGNGGNAVLTPSVIVGDHECMGVSWPAGISSVQLTRLSTGAPALGDKDKISAWLWVDAGHLGEGITDVLVKYKRGEEPYGDLEVNWIPTVAGEWQHFEASLADFSLTYQGNPMPSVDPTYVPFRVHLRNGTFGSPPESGAAASFYIRDLAFVSGAVVEYHSGDANKDGKVTDADYTIWADNYNATNATWEQGDFNKDGTVTDADYTLWADNYGFGVTGGVVPEPATISLLGLGLLGLLRKRCQ